ncbi:beta-N-acetylhexosaminidase [Christiangramia sabulilitoris]|uniref:beta-N-acetylhexosaminidase n=1 Tax=Christiangramia sabulilitoris TaxID=2583991 RepID=A0A550I837_9FLAO|nr:family 20 glycosylhydrolase [Christiangramia sabulilitoris]TRO67145.1 family 20 glycosylhydrolase [Christiangramia sabulilitoris]
MDLKLFKISSLLAAFLLCVSCTGIKDTAVESQVSSTPEIIPLPVNVSWKTGFYSVPANNIICYDDKSKESAAWLERLLVSAGLKPTMVQGSQQNCGNWQIEIDENLTGKLGEEGYVLDIRDNGVNLKAGTNVGLFYAIQTLRQFFPAEVEKTISSNSKINLKQAYIEDSPEFSWRGTMVDVSRSFFGLEYLKAHVDRMALYKMNRLHLHLTDDQGWRIEIKSKPRLTEVASKSSVKGGRSGFLTQEEYKELQDYAAKRNIIIIPEIDMPGHIYSALLAYPELNCPEFSNIEPKKALPPNIYDGYDVGWSRFCLDKPETYEFVSAVISELAEITQGPYIHMGGDEIEDPLYEEFVVKADSIINSYNKIPIGWEEVTKAEVSENMISQQWTGRTDSVVEGLKVIESICSHFYLDHGNTSKQPNTATWCKEDGINLQEVYDFSASNPNVIGVEAPVWTEYVLDDASMDNRFWPRAVAVAEIGWTPQGKRNFRSFTDRLAGHGARLSNMGIYFFQSPEVKWKDHKTAPGFNGVFHGFTPPE